MPHEGGGHCEQYGDVWPTLYMTEKIVIFSISWLLLAKFEGVVGWCEGAVYLTSPGRPTDIGLQLGKACYPCSG